MFRIAVAALLAAASTAVEKWDKVVQAANIRAD
jgi:hypothetical protein